MQEGTSILFCVTVCCQSFFRKEKRIGIRRTEKLFLCLDTLLENFERVW